MKKKSKFLIMLLSALSLFSLAVAATGCSPIEDIKTAINQSRCKHEWGAEEETKSATCTEKGELTKTCTICEKVETVETETLPHIAVYIEAVAPKCNEVGYTDGTKCGVCDTMIVAPQEIPALGHVVVADLGFGATCLDDGLTDGQHCSRCDEVLVAQMVIPAFGHTLVDIPAVEPSCSEKGNTMGVKCDTCETFFVEPESIAKLPCVDENEDSVCDVCGCTGGELILNRYNNAPNLKKTNYDGQVLPSGSVIRLYKTDDNSRAYLNFQAQNVGSFNLFAFGDSRHSIPYFILGDSVASSVVDYDLSGDFSYVEYDEYIDFYIGDFSLTYSYKTTVVGTDEYGNTCNIERVETNVKDFNGDFTIMLYTSNQVDVLTLV